MVLGDTIFYIGGIICGGWTSSNIYSRLLNGKGEGMKWVSDCCNAPVIPIQIFIGDEDYGVYQCAKCRRKDCGIHKETFIEMVKRLLRRKP